MSPLREGRANTARGAGHFLRETVGRVRHAGARGQLTVRADSGFYTHSVVSVCRKMDLRFSITIRQHQSLRNLIEAIPEEDWHAHPLLDGRRRRCGGDHLQSLSQKSKTITIFGLWMPVKTELCCLPATFRNWTLS